MRLRTFVVGCVVALLVVVLVAGCGLAVVSSLPSGEHPDVDFRGAEIAAARTALASALEAELDAVERRSGFVSLGPRGRQDRCEAGQYNFTREDRYAYVCRMQVYQAIAVPEPFHENASRLGEALAVGTCSYGTDTDRALAQPYASLQDLRRMSGDCVTGPSVGAPEIIGWIPARPSPGELKHVRLRFSHRCLSSFHREHCEVEPLDLRALIASARSGTSHLAIVIAEDTYYTVPWDCPWPASWYRASCQ